MQIMQNDIHVQSLICLAYVLDTENEQLCFGWICVLAGISVLQFNAAGKCPSWMRLIGVMCLWHEGKLLLITIINNHNNSKIVYYMLKKTHILFYCMFKWVQRQTRTLAHVFDVKVPCFFLHCCCCVLSVMEKRRCLMDCADVFGD